MSSANDADSNEFEWVRIDDPDEEFEAPELEHTVQHYDDQPTQCTIYPPAAERDHMFTQWISATEGAFVDVDAMR